MLQRITRRAWSDLRGITANKTQRRIIARNYAHGALKRVVPIIGTETAGGDAVFSRTDDKVIGRYLYSRGAWDADALPTALRLANLDLNGKLMVEVGANIGTTTLQAARLGARVLAFEPEPWNYRLLRANMAVNDVDAQVETVKAGCSSENRPARMSKSAVNSGDHRVDDSGDTAIDLLTLDSELARRSITPESVGLLWTDTQGHEPDVLAGASTLLTARVPLVMEFWPDMIGDRLGEVADRLAPYETIIDLNTEKVVELEQAATDYGHRWTNLLALPA